MLASMTAPQTVPQAESRPEILFYDGHCALCHGAVKFVLKHDASGAAFRFAPLHGETFAACVPESAQKTLPDSIVVVTREGSWLVRSDAFVHILARLGGGWRFVAGVLRVVPRPLRDMVYNLVARARYRVFGTRTDVCPVVPQALRSRFDP
jgi:predicted DCC family thiol-disulfide oxidoreductase YuxK